jgi:hypothetical protein
MQRVIILIVISSLIAFRAKAADMEILDQQFIEDNSAHPGSRCYFGITDDWEAAQSFAVGKSGLLSRIELMVQSFSEEPIILHLYSISYSIPDQNIATATALAPYTSNNDNNFSWISFDLRSNNIQVDAGEPLAVGLTPSSGGFTLWKASYFDDPGAVYDGGRMFRKSPSSGYQWMEYSDYPDNDLEFRTYVIIPEPSTIVMLLLALTLGGLLWRWA